MVIPPQVLMMMANKIKEDKKKVGQNLNKALNTSVVPAAGAAGAMINMYNDQSGDPNVGTAMWSGALRDGAAGYQSNGLSGLIGGGIMGGLSSAISTINRKEQNYEQEQNKYFNDMYSSVVGDDYNLASLANAKDGGEIVPKEGDGEYIPIQTEAKKVGRKLIKEKLVFTDGTMSNVNATKPHSEMKKDEVTDIVKQGTYVFPVNTKLTKKDLEFVFDYGANHYSENGKNVSVKEIRLKDVLGESFEGSLAEAADIIDKKYPVMDVEDNFDSVSRITNKENIANRSKIIAHLIRVNESKINGTKLEEEKISPSMNAMKGGSVNQKNKKMSGYIKSYKKGGKVVDPNLMKELIKEKGTKIDPNYTKGVVTKMPISPNAVSRSNDDLPTQYLKGMGMNQESNIVIPKDDYPFSGIPTQKMNPTGMLSGTGTMFRGDQPTNAPTTTGKVAATGGGSNKVSRTRGGQGGAKTWKDKEVTERWQKKLGVTVDGVWGPETDKAFADYNMKQVAADGNRMIESQNKNKDLLDKIPKMGPDAASDDEDKGYYGRSGRDGTSRRDRIEKIKADRASGKISAVEYAGRMAEVDPLELFEGSLATGIGLALPGLFSPAASAAAPALPAAGTEVAKRVVTETGKQVARRAGTEVAKKETGKQVAKRFGTETGKKIAEEVVGEVMDSGTIKNTVESIRTAIINARKAGDRGKVQELMKTLQELRKNNPSAGMYKKGGYVRRMAAGGMAGDPPKGKSYKKGNNEFVVGADGKYYMKKNDGSYDIVDAQTSAAFQKDLSSANGGGWAMLSNSSDSNGGVKKKSSPNLSLGVEYNPAATMDPINLGPTMQGAFAGSSPVAAAAASAWNSTQPDYNPTATMDPINSGGQEMIGIFPDITGFSPSVINPSITNPDGTTNNPTSPTNVSPSNGIDDVLNLYKDKIDERMTDAQRDAQEAKEGYSDLAKRTGARDLAQMVIGIGGTLLQNRKEPVVLKRPFFKRLMSAQQINAEGQAATGAGVEAAKYINSFSDLHSTASFLASNTISRLTEQEGRIRKGYVDDNLQKVEDNRRDFHDTQYDNRVEKARGERVEIDNTNNAISKTTSIINKYLGSRNEADMANFSVNRQIGLDLKGDIYALSNQRLGIDIMGMDYKQQIAEINLKKQQIADELRSVNIDEENRKKLEQEQKELDLLRKKIAEYELKNKK